MSCWTDQWKDFVTRTSYLQTLAEEKISNDQFWRSYGIYDQALMYSGYPGEILAKISSYISPGATLLDIGAGTGAFAIPLSRKTAQTIAVDPSEYQLQILSEKARREGLTNIVTIKKEWKDVLPSEISSVLASSVDISDADISGEHVSGADISRKHMSKADNATVDYSLAAYSLFDEDIEHFLIKMIDATKKVVFIVFRANGIDSLHEFAYGPRPYADYNCLYHILKDLGYQFDAMLFPRNYSLPIDLVLQQYRFCKKSHEELLGHLSLESRLEERADGIWASFQATDALLYLIR
jgi:SAM-dependent methyltransferase